MRWIAGAALLAATLAFAQQNPKAHAPTPKTGWGHPDLQGIWDFATITPFERPAELAGKATFSKEEAEQFEKKTNENRNQDRRDGSAEADVARAYNHIWWDFGSRVVGTRQTSLVVDPPDGRVPEMTEDGKRRAAERRIARERPAQGPEDRSLWERCIIGGNSGPPMAPSAYNNNVQIFQTKDSVVLLTEMINDSRVVPLDGRPHLPPNVRQWRGDSRGRWEGDTLVVDTTNFRDDSAFRGGSKDLHLIEKYTRVSPDMLLYQYTITDPKTWTKPWTVALPMRKTAGPIYEYACHEGNYGMVNLLSGARTQER